VINMKEVLGVAVIMARPDSPFLKRFLTEMEKRFDGDRCYSCHSTILGRELAINHPGEVRVLNYTSFYYPGWTLDAMKLLFEPSLYTPGESMFPDRGTFYGMHLFESHENFQRYFPKITEDWIETTDTHFSVLMRKFF